MSIGAADTSGLGNLADELGETWGQEDSGVQSSSFLQGLREGSLEAAQNPVSPSALGQTEFPPPGSVQSPVSTSSETYQTLSAMLSPLEPPKPPRNTRHRRDESQYDGSDYGPESESDDFTNIPPSFAKRLREFERVTRFSMNTEDTLSEDGGVLKRTTRALKDLGPQTGIENGCTRLITAFTSLATHRTHKTRELFSQAHSLLFANSASTAPSPLSTLPEELLDLLLSELSDLSQTLSPISLHSPSPLLSLQILGSDSTTLLATLRGISDTLTESKQLTSTASRRHKSVRELLSEMTLEDALVQESILLIQAGDWDRRCRERMAARICREEVTGFQKTCDIARERWVGRCQRDHAKGIDEFATVKGVRVVA